MRGEWLNQGDSVAWKDAIASLAERAGYRLMPLWRERDLALELHLRRLFERYDVRTVLDVGANVGQYRGFLRERVAFHGQIESFEPQPALHEQLRVAASSDPAWRIHGLGLGSTDGALQLNVMASHSFSSFHQPDNSAAPQFESSNRIVETVTVPVRRLDDLDLELQEGVYLKVDTQGFDLEVLRGAARTLERVCAVQIELPLVNIYKGAPQRWDMLRELEGMGFAVSGFFAVSDDERLRLIETDCVMVRA